MKPSEVLQEALTELKKGPQTWTKGEYAKDATGDRVRAISRDAVCRCAVGLVQLASGNTPFLQTPEGADAVRYLAKAMTGKLPRNYDRGHLVVTNDNDKPETKYEDVVAIFEKAVVMAKKVGR